MEIRLSQSDISEIVKIHLENKGYQVKEIYSDYKEGTEYEYYGDPQNESRREIKVKKFNGLMFTVEGI
jgi:hypothetical protein